MDDNDDTRRSNLGSSFLVGSLNCRSSSKKPKQRKVPQRGLGVAQLEKIRLEEQQNKKVENVVSSSTLSTPLQIPTHFHSNQSSLSIAYPTVSQADFSSSNNSVTRLSYPTQNVDFDNLVSPPLLNQASCVGFEASWPGMAMLGQEDGSKTWSSCEYVKRVNDGADIGVNMPFQSSFFLPYQSNLSCCPIQFAQECPQSSSISANSASAIFSSSMLNFPLEPPSNQNYYFHGLTKQSQNEEKIRGVKRPYLFSIDNPSSLSSNFQSLPSIPIRSDASALYENGASFKNLNFSPSCSTSTFARNQKKNYNGSCVDGDILTLATPSASHDQEPPDFELLPFQSGDDVVTFKSEKRSPPFYSFLPPADVTSICHAACKNNGEIGDSVDLNLKL